MTVLPMLVIIGLWIFFIRQMQVGGGKAMSFGKSRARVFLKEQGKKVTFKDVAGIEESKEEVTEIIEFLRDPQKFTKLGDYAAYLDSVARGQPKAAEASGRRQNRGRARFLRSRKAGSERRPAPDSTVRNAMQFLVR